MFPSLATQGNMSGNNVSATIFPSFPGLLYTRMKDWRQTFSSNSVLVDVKLKESCSLSVSRDLILSADFSLNWKLKNKKFVFEFVKKKK